MGLAFFCYDDELMLLIPDLDPHSIAPVMFAKILCESRSVIFSRFALFTNSELAERPAKRVSRASLHCYGTLRT